MEIREQAIALFLMVSGSVPVSQECAPEPLLHNPESDSGFAERILFPFFLSVVGGFFVLLPGEDFLFHY